METRTEAQAQVAHVGDIGAMLVSWQRSLRAANRSPRTVQSYSESALQLEAFLVANGMPSQVDRIAREHIEAYTEDVLGKWKPATAALRFRSLQQFFKWLVEEGEIQSSPMARMKPPRVAEEPPEVLSDDELRRLLATCKGNEFEERRDQAVLRVFIDSGARLSEVADIQLEDLHLEDGLIRVTGKGRKPRLAPVGVKAIKALDRYLRKRPQHHSAELPQLWLGKKGAFGISGIAQMMRRRAKQARIDHLNPHRFRHTTAHRWLSGGGTEGDLMQIAGWKSRQMLGRYGASAAHARAVEAHRRLALGDKL